MRAYRTDYRLWGICAGGLFLVPFLLLALVYLVACAVQPGGPSAQPLLDVLPEGLGVFALLALGAATVGWLIHAAIVMSGGWEPPRPTDPQAGDYDDRPTAG